MPGCCDTSSDRFALDPLPIIASKRDAPDILDYATSTGFSVLEFPTSTQLVAEKPTTSVHLVAEEPTTPTETQPVETESAMVSPTAKTTFCYTEPTRPGLKSCQTLSSVAEAKLLSTTFLSQETAGCINAQEMLLWLLFYNIFTALANLALGSQSSRKAIAGFLGREETDMGAATWLYLLGNSALVSLILQVAGTVGATYILATNEFHSPVHFLFGYLAARPLATSLVIWLTMVNPEQYLMQAMEVLWADLWFSVISVYAFGLAASKTNLHIGTYPVNVSLVRAGSALGLLTIVLMVGYLLSSRCIMNGGVKLTDRRKLDLQDHGFWFPVVPTALHFLRYAACWLLWSGKLLITPEAFCPSTKSLLEIMALWMLLPVLDNVLRAWIAGRKTRGVKLSYTRVNEEGVNQANQRLLEAPPMQA